MQRVCIHLLHLQKKGIKDKRKFCDAICHVSWSPSAHYSFEERYMICVVVEGEGKDAVWRHSLGWTKVTRKVYCIRGFIFDIRVDIGHIFLYYSLAVRDQQWRVELCVGGHDYVVCDLVKWNAFIGRTWKICVLMAMTRHDRFLV